MQLIEFPHQDDLNGLEQICLAVACACAPDIFVPRRLIAIALHPQDDDTDFIDAAIQVLVIAGYLAAPKPGYVVVGEQASFWFNKQKSVSVEELCVTCIEDGLQRYAALALMADEVTVLTPLSDQARYITDRAINTSSQRAFALAALLGQAFYRLKDMEAAGFYLAVAIRLFDPANRLAIDLYINSLAVFTHVLVEHHESGHAVELLEKAFQLALPRRRDR